MRDVTGAGWTTAHTGTVAAGGEPDEERLARAAGLTAEETACFAEQARGATLSEAAARLRLSVRQVRARIETGHRKLAELAAQIRAMGGDS